jgi:hypothetical protein
MPRIYICATRKDQAELLNFFKHDRGLFIQPGTKGYKNFEEAELLEGHLTHCNVGKIPYDEIIFTPKDIRNEREQQNKFNQPLQISNLTYPVIEWTWSEQTDKYILIGRLEWDITSKIESQLYSYIFRGMSNDEEAKQRALVHKYYPMCQEMKKEFSAAQRWIRKNWDNGKKGEMVWYGPEAKVLIDSKQLEATSFIPGTVDFNVIYTSNDETPSQIITTKSWKIFDFLTRKK